ncbi:MAG: helix-turn-helix transcriptional regulator [Arcobacter sp.]
MSKVSSTYRVIEILKDLEDGKLLCLTNLAYKYDTSERSIRRDFELIREIFGDIIISPQKGCYQVVSKNLLDNVLNSTELYMLKNILKLSDKSKLSLSKDVDENIKKAMLKEESDSPYLFKQKPYEEIYENKEKFKFLEHAIKFRKEIRFRYTNLDKINYFILKPYKIVFLSENFYLASEIELKRNGVNVTMSRIAMIDELSTTGNSFYHNHDIMNYINYAQSPWATYKPNFKEHLKEVVIEVPKEQAKYFKLKKFFPSQKILSEDENGTIQISYTVTSENEVVGLIKQWIPHVKIISPQSLINLFEKVAKDFYKV